jgi:hypothetical protein
MEWTIDNGQLTNALRVAALQLNFWSSESKQACLICRVVTKVSTAKMDH